jgi:hypothetical protein
MTTTAGYEFNERENETFKGLVAGMKRAGGAVAAGSAIHLAYQVALLGQHAGWWMPRADAGGAGVYFDFGIWLLLSAVGGAVALLLFKATAGFHAVIHTEGDDVKHLMSGLEKLRTIVNLIFWTAAAGSGLLAVSFVLLLTGKA